MALLIFICRKCDGSGGEPAKGESSAREKERRMNDWLALPEMGHPTAQTEGD